MGRPKKKIPSYLPHASGQARVRINGRDIYLGKFGSPESKEKYARLIAEHFSDQTTRTVVTAPGESLAIASLVVKYDDFALEYYKKNDKPTSQVERIRMAVRPLVKLYGNLPTDEFSPKKLKAVRAQMIRDGSQRKAHKGNTLSRGYVNCLVSCIKRMFKWAVAEELIPVEVFQRVDAVENLKKGRCSNVREPEPIYPVAQELIDPVMKLACPQIRAMIQLQLLTGMRPDEVTIMRPQDIERTGDLWIYRPGNHKTEHHEIQKQILLGPQAQKVVEPWLDREDSAFLFSPREVMEAFNDSRRRKRKTPMTPSQARRKRKTKPAKAPREHYDDSSYRQAVHRACKKAGVPKWSPGQLRHNTATRIRSKYGIEAAQVVLGHENLSTTEIYAEKDMVRYSEIMAEIG